MSAATRPRPLDRLGLSQRELLAGAALLNAELLAVLVYLATQPVAVTAPRYILYGFVWINVGLLAVARTDPAPAGPRTRRVGLAVAGGYLLVLSVAGGLLGAGHGSVLAGLLGGHGHPGSAGGLGVRLLPPGWGPAVVYEGHLLAVRLIPYKLVGYLALSYLVYATVLDAVTASVGGALGLLSCVSCAWPVLGEAAGLLAGGSALAVAATTWPYDLSTAAFLATVALLYWRPFGR